MFTFNIMLTAKFLREKSGWRHAPSGRWQHGDLFWRLSLVCSSALVVILVTMIGWEVWTSSAPSRHEFGWAFISPWAKATWNPALDKFQAWPAIYGSLVTSIIALLLAVPFSIAVAIFLAELAPPVLRTPLNYMVEMLAAVPSVVYGLWGIYVFLPTIVAPLGNALAGTLGKISGLATFFAGPMPVSGLSRLAAALILTFMVMPTITAVTRDVLLAIPRSQREASLALGATQWETIWKVLLPMGLSGILGAVILGSAQRQRRFALRARDGE